MWGMCHPKNDEELKECAELGKSLNRLSQPVILTILAANNKPMHGYIIVQEAAKSPMFGGKKPDATGIYRTLKRLEESGFVTSEWDTPEEGSAKRMFTLTDKGRSCLRRWIDSLACYQLTLQEFRQQSSRALEIDLPDAPICAHSVPDYLLYEPKPEFRFAEGRDIAALQGPRPLNIVGAYHAVAEGSEETGVDFATCAWVMPVSHEPAMVAVSLKPSSHTLQSIKETGHFSLSILPASEEALQVAQTCGNNTGAQVDKGTLVDYGFVAIDQSDEASASLPVISLATSWETCAVESITEAGDHILVVGKVINASTGCDIDKQGRVFPNDTLLCVQHDKFAKPNIIL